MRTGDRPSSAAMHEKDRTAASRLERHQWRRRDGSRGTGPLVADECRHASHRRIAKELVERQWPAEGLFKKQMELGKQQ